MKSIKDVYKIGAGPSSSHTMGPENAAKLFMEKYSDLESVDVFLYDSLALTGKGHLTDWIIKKTFGDIPINIFWQPDVKKVKHENAMEFVGKLENGKKVNWEVYSIGGGDIDVEGYEGSFEIKDVYPHNNLGEIKIYCAQNDLNFFQYVMKYEPEIIEYLKEVWEVMKQSINNGLEAEGIIPGALELKKKAKRLYASTGNEKELKLNAYAYAVKEENASGGTIVTAPTCGASGVLPAVLRYYKEELKLDDSKVIEALAVAGLFGAVVKKNATVSGAEAGCQAEVGVATSMAAAAIMYLNGGTNREVESAAEIGLEHQIGLTCDPVLGYVQIPCIQRNAVAAVKAKTSYLLAHQIADDEEVDFDTIVKVMYETGKDLKPMYRETSLGGLAKYFKSKQVEKDNGKK